MLIHRLAHLWHTKWAENRSILWGNINIQFAPRSSDVTKTGHRGEIEKKRMRWWGSGWGGWCARWRENMFPAVRGERSQREENPHSLICDNRTVAALCHRNSLGSCFHCLSFFVLAADNSHDQWPITLTPSCNSVFFLLSGYYWPDLKDFVVYLFFLKTSMGSISFFSWPLQGWKPQTSPSCCWETTVVICLLSVLIIDSDSEMERERDRGRGSERPWLVERRRKKEERRGC